MAEAFQTFERMNLVEKRFPTFFGSFAADLGKAMELFECGYCYPLSERDEEGRRIIMLQAARMNIEKFSPYDAVRLFVYVCLVLLEEEETQISGILMVTNDANSTLKHMISPIEMMDFMEFVKKCASFRQKGIYMLNLPAFSSFCIDIMKSVMSEKLRSRLHVLKPSEQLKDYINPSLLPKESGGIKPEVEMMNDFRKLEAERREKVLQRLNVKVNWLKAPYDKIWSSGEDESGGSFRKLEID